jgi:ribosome recycling factor
MKNLISRKDLIKKLEEYCNGKISLDDLLRWHNKMLKENFKPDDWEGDDSFINEVMMRIDMSDIDGLPIPKAKEIVKLLGLSQNTKELTKKLYELK